MARFFKLQESLGNYLHLQQNTDKMSFLTDFAHTHMVVQMTAVTVATPKGVKTWA